MMHFARSILIAVITICPQTYGANLFSTEESDRIVKACLDLGQKFAQYLDTGEYGKLATLFEENGEFIKPGGKYSGRESIDLGFKQIPKDTVFVHVISNEVAEIHSKNLVVVTSYITRYHRIREKPGQPITASEILPTVIIKNYDECVRTEDDTWLWQTRDATLVFVIPPSASTPQSSKPAT